MSAKSPENNYRVYKPFYIRTQFYLFQITGGVGKMKDRMFKVWSKYLLSFSMKFYSRFS